MGFLNDMVNGLTTGFGLAMAEQIAFGTPPVNPGSHMVRACCAQLKWGIHEQIGDSGFALHFNDPVVGTRRLGIQVSDSGHIVLFSVFSAVRVSPQLLTAEVLGHFLRRNREMSFPAWQVSTEDGLKISLSYCVPVGGLSPPFFSFLCTEMCQEVAEFDSKMRQAGLL